eukprot:54122-Amphidinium_carterae.1
MAQRAAGSLKYRGNVPDTCGHEHAQTRKREEESRRHPRIDLRFSEAQKKTRESSERSTLQLHAASSFAGPNARNGLHAKEGSSVSAKATAVDSKARIPNECIPSFCQRAALDGANFYGKSAVDASPFYSKDSPIVARYNFDIQEGYLNSKISCP